MICRATGLVGRLNAFQRVMLQWSELRPYNATHTYQISGPVDLAALQNAIRDALDDNGLGVAEIDPDGVWYSHQRDDAPDAHTVTWIDGDGQAEDRLEAHIESELNRPFERPRCRPFRFSVVDAGPGSHFVTLTYDHWVADSVGARLVMRHVLGRYLGLQIPENEQTLDLCPGTYREVFAHRLAGRRLAGPMLRSLQGWLGNRSTWRVAYSAANQMAIGYGSYRVKPGTVSPLRQFARENDASVNDVFLAALCRAMAPFLPRRRSKAGARDMTLGTIVDTRGDASVDLSESLGTFLGYYLVRVAGDGAIGLGELSRRIAVKTRERKEQRSYLDSAVNFRVASAIWPHLKPENRVHFARRALPLTAGISNVHLRGSWIEEQGAGRICDYRRAASNGPSLPLVISPTTLGGEMNVSVSYRTAGFSRSRIDGIMGSFVEQLETLDGQACKRKISRHTGTACGVSA